MNTYAAGSYHNLLVLHRQLEWLLETHCLSWLSLYLDTTALPVHASKSLELRFLSDLLCSLLRHFPGLLIFKIRIEPRHNRDNP